MLSARGSAVGSNQYRRVSLKRELTGVAKILAALLCYSPRALMAILQDADREQLARLLALYPVAQLKDTWNDIRADDKEQLCEAIAANKPTAQIAAFIDNAFGFCKQHVYLFSHARGGAIKLPSEIVGGERVRARREGNLYVATLVTDVVLLDPPEEASIEFLWPIRIDVVAKHVSIRFVVLEKDIPSYFDRKALTKGHGLSEAQVIDGVATDMSLDKLDVHKGMKHLWKNEYMDCHVTRYRKSKSSAMEIVDRTERKGIRENDPALFNILMRSEVRESLFFLEKPDAGVKKVGIDPSVGRLSFLQYASKGDAIEDVIRKVLQNN